MSTPTKTLADYWQLGFIAYYLGKMKIPITDYYTNAVIFRNPEQLQEYIAMEMAEFIRDNMAELNKHPTDYDDHYSYIIDLYNRYTQELLEDSD